MNLRLSRIKKTDLLISLDWRELELSSLRTSHFILDSEQEDFYESLKKRKDILYYSVRDEKNSLVALCGFVNMNLINRNAEIAIILNPYYRGSGQGKKIVDMLIDHGFKNIGLKNIYGECYMSNKNKSFWENIIEEKGLFSTTLPEKKFYNGKFYDGLYFNFKNPIS